MREYLKVQLERAMPLTQEHIDSMVAKTDYFDQLYVPGMKTVSIIIQSEIESDYPELVGVVPNLYMTHIADESLPILEEQYNYVRQADMDGAIPIFKSKHDEL